MSEPVHIIAGLRRMLCGAEAGIGVNSWEDECASCPECRREFVSRIMHDLILPLAQQPDVTVFVGEYIAGTGVLLRIEKLAGEHVSTVLTVEEASVLVDALRSQIEHAAAGESWGDVAAVANPSDPTDGVHVGVNASTIRLPPQRPSQQSHTELIEAHALLGCLGG